MEPGPNEPCTRRSSLTLHCHGLASGRAVSPPPTGRCGCVGAGGAGAHPGLRRRALSLGIDGAVAFPQFLGVAGAGLTEWHMAWGSLLHLHRPPGH